MLFESSTTAWTITFAIAVGLVVYRHWRRDRSVGLLLTYLLSFSVLHGLASAIRLLPWFETPYGDMTLDGLRQSTLGLIAFAIGVEIANRRKVSVAGEEPLDQAPIPVRLVTVYLAVGLAVYTLFLMAGRLPIIAAIVSTGSTLVAVSVALKCWGAQSEGRPFKMWLWLALTAIFPFVTVVTQGFLGYGFMAMLIVASFAASLQRSRWRAAVVGLVVLYGGLSVYVTYMRDRSDIRDVVWRGERVDARIDQLQNTLINYEWFDPRLTDHLNRIERRLNQNHLVGAAVVSLRDGYVEHANGGTLADAVLAVIPRALWPDKPEFGGSGDIVSRYTGFQFAFGTSVGVGQVMEFYINFGTPGVILGFLAVGWMIGTVDRRSAFYLARGDVPSFTLWYMPGLSLLQIGGSFAEVTATAAASWALVRIVSKFAKNLQVSNVDYAADEPEPLDSRVEPVDPRVEPVR